jgi:hypothetical protein
MDSKLNPGPGDQSQNSASSSCGTGVTARAAWVKPMVVVEEMSQARSGGSNFLNLDGGSTCAS